MSVTVRISIDDRRLLAPVTTPRFGLFLATEWKRLIDPYTPRLTGTMQNAQIAMRPWEIEYFAPYAHYMYEGVVYVDPVYHVSGWFSEERGWWSRRGVKKVPSGRTFNYGRVNPFSTHHWDQAAKAAGQVDKLAQTAEAALRTGRF